MEIDKRGSKGEKRRAKVEAKLELKWKGERVVEEEKRGIVAASVRTGATYYLPNSRHLLFQKVK